MYPIEAELPRETGDTLANGLPMDPVGAYTLEMPDGVAPANAEENFRTYPEMESHPSPPLLTAHDPLNHFDAAPS